MLKLKTYSCQVCKTKPDQLSHHKSHLETEKHKDKIELFQLKLTKLSSEQILAKYNSTDIEIIIDALVNTVYEYKEDDNKKLNIETVEQEDIINQEDTINNTIELTSEEMSAQNTSDTITNKEALKDKIHELHNYLRNNGAGYGMNALKVFNILYGLKKIEEKNLFEKANLKVPDAKFSYLLELAKRNTPKDDELLQQHIDENVLNAINESNIKDLLMYEIPKKMKGSVFAHLIKEIDSITKIEAKSNVLLSGKIYEYFIGRDETAISELGAYFTDRHIVDYIFNKLKPTINDDGTIETMIDMFGGSGGFTTGYINYLNTTYNNSSIPIENHINWETELKKIFHFDMNEDVIKSAGLEFFCLTGTLPDMKHNLCYSNSFVDDFLNKKFKYPITNPPYGGDKNKETDTQVKRNKIKEYIKKRLVSTTDEDKKAILSIQLKEIDKAEKFEKKESEKSKVSVDMSSARIQKFAKKYSLKGNDKESVSLMLIMDIVDIGGTAVGVLKEGVFFNKSYKDLRKCLVENFNVREIISVPQDQFENTKTKTSIVIFDNLENIKTTEVKFYDLVVERYTEDKFIEARDGRIYLSENKDDISGISDKLISNATREEILSNPIVSLNGKDYNKKVIVCGEGYELVKLGDISIINKNKKLDKVEYNYVEISDINNGAIIKSELIQTSDLPANAKNIGEYGNILISCVRPKNSKMMLITKNINNIEKYVFSSALANIKLNDVKLSYYIYGILYILVENFEKDLCNGSSYPRFKPTELNNLQIPIPKSPAKIAEWVEKISKPYDEKNTKQAKIQDLEKQIQLRIKNITEDEECEEVELGSICKIMSGSKTNLNNFLINKSPYKIIRTRNLSDSTDYLYLNKEGIIKCQTKLLNKNDILMSSFADSYVCKIIPDDFIGSTFNGGLFKIYDLKINKYYFINNIISENFKNQIKNISSGSTVLLFNIDNLLKIKIRIPNNKKLIDDMEPLFNEIETLQTDVKKADELYKQLIQELSKEAIPTQNTAIITETTSSTPDITDEEKTEPIVEEVKSKSKAKATNKKISIKKDKSKTSLNDILNEE